MAHIGTPEKDQGLIVAGAEQAYNKEDIPCHGQLTSYMTERIQEMDETDKPDQDGLGI